jgi:segregation and condensation protein A
VLRYARTPQVHDVISRPIDVDGFIEVVRAVIALRAVARFRDVVPPGAEPWEVLSGLLALLELARRGELRLNQPRPFASVEIRRELAGEAA